MYVFIERIFYVDIFKCALQHFIGDFARLLYGAVHNLFLMQQVEFTGAPRTEWVKPDHNTGNFILLALHVPFSLPLHFAAIYVQSTT